METRPGWWVGLGKERQNVVLVELFNQKNMTGKSRTPSYVIGVETVLDDGSLDGYEDESEKLKALYSSKDTEIYHCLLVFNRNGYGVEIAKQTYNRLT